MRDPRGEEKLLRKSSRGACGGSNEKLLRFYSLSSSGPCVSHVCHLGFSDELGTRLIPSPSSTAPPLLFLSSSLHHGGLVLNSRSSTYTDHETSAEERGLRAEVKSVALWMDPVFGGKWLVTFTPPLPHLITSKLVSSPSPPPPTKY